MPTRSYLPSFLHSLPLALLSLWFILASHAAGSSPNKPLPNNGQPGTPNLPLASSRFVDTNHMTGNSNHIGYMIEDYLSTQFQLDVIPFLTALQTEVKSYDSSKSEEDRDKVIKTLGQIQTLLNSYQTKHKPIAYKSHYVGAEIRSGDGATTFTFPEVSYTNELSGYNIGISSSTETGNTRNYSSLGLSFRYEVTNQGRGLTKEIQSNDAAVKSADDAKNRISDLTKLVTDLTKSIKSGQYPQEFNEQEFDKSLSDLIRDYPDYQKAVSDANPPIASRVNATVFSLLISESTRLADDVVRQSRSPALSVFAGTRFVDGGGSVISEGLSASQLFLLGSGKAGRPGVALLCVVQGVYASLPQGNTQGGVQNGVAVIFQDRTAAKNDAYSKTALSGTTPVDLLRPRWAVKFGVEYTAPIFGRSKMYTAFVRYRDPKTYFEITPAFGGDGRGGTYFGVSFGQSSLF